MFKKTIVASILTTVCMCSVSAQLKTRPEQKPVVSESLVRSEESGLMFGWFDPSRFNMRQSYSMTYSSFGGRGLTIGEYVNSMFYRISDPLSVQFDLSLTHSPFNSLGGRYSNELNGFRLSRAQLNYRPTENMFFQVQFRQFTPGNWLRGFDRFESDFGLDRPEEQQR
ncbi:MAG: hypothetical protein A2X67_08240 [Ignavibacteria bacterium GWA2_55_11]|nr:MAG: hypothetical protein A2X67_08240 [Ignavibacteria bacterium GWA2_55_11]OGU46826.1 MAG: hypothetical protein A2X68_03095 [Ignavibacteria bacterium GWC2_56_12]OGU69766.1 MAG: hypothetical protein A3H45_11960 [Ignavibacteria bacterium RIFCSPLOWO2_02_FULL_55_14]HAV23273.1 hypothetical protein [Bacteroidota bacterium]